MAEPAIRFDDGAAYEQYMGVWSRLAGHAFLLKLRDTCAMPGGQTRCSSADPQDPDDSP